MLISKAHAAVTGAGDELLDIAAAPTPMESFMSSMGLIVVLVALFYLLLIMPQQRRFKEHSNMLSDLKKGDRVVTGGGLVGRIEKIIDDKEVLVDLGNGVKVTALRSMIQGKTEIKPAANDGKTSTTKKTPEKKSAAKPKADSASTTKSKTKDKTKVADKAKDKDKNKKDTKKA